MSISRSLVLPLLGLALVGTSGCARLRMHQGYVVDTDLVNSVQPGVDTRQSVLATLGRPTFTSQFGPPVWYYASRETRSYAYQNPHPVAVNNLRVTFDQNGVVRGVDRLGIDQVASIYPAKRTTPTLGRKRSFFDELFGNIGAVSPGGGAGGGGGGGGQGGGSGGRDQP